MGLLTRLLGAKSKYDKSIPYLYEARVRMEGFGDDEYEAYFGETICALLQHLHENGVAPADATIVEVFEGKETVLENDHLLDESGGWLYSKPELCKALKEHYAGHIFEHTCDFDDRNKKGIGPY